MLSNNVRNRVLVEIGILISIWAVILIMEMGNNSEE